MGGVAIIKVGAPTETEMKERKARVEDALHAKRAAVQEGIVPGGGVALIRAQAALDTLQLEGEQRFGLQIIRRAIEEPMRQIAANAGVEVRSSSIGSRPARRTSVTMPRQANTERSLPWA